MDIVKKLGPSFTGHQVDGCWYVQQDGFTVMQVAIETTKSRREDFSGLRNYRYVYESRCKVEVRVGSRQFVEIPQAYLFYLGNLAAIREVVKHFIAGHIIAEARRTLEDAAKVLGASDLALMNALRVDEEKHALQVLMLVQKLTPEVQS